MGSEWATIGFSATGTVVPGIHRPHRYFEDAGPCPEGGESDHPALVWLDRRVDEMRVAL